MKAVVTVTGKDRQGIIAKVSSFLWERGANIEDISQTVLGEYFAMIMIANVSQIKMELAALAKECAELGKQIGMSIYLQHEDIFNAMHNI
ncbi:MAG: ACT domain-containing protein [Clostridia bacterium]|nr:ACT domain-containing protein [Clostridia bacterium]